MADQTNSSEQAEGRSSAKRRRMALAGVFAAAGLALCAWSWQYYRKVYQTPKQAIPILEMIPVVHQSQRQAVSNTVSGAMKLMAFLPAAQRDQAREIWKEPPRTLDDLIEKQKKFDQILTPEQRQRVKPIRKYVQDKIVDEMFEPGRKRFPPGEFEKMKDEVKRRVEKRMNGQ